jgi:HlyD family secretion protein
MVYRKWLLGIVFIVCAVALAFWWARRDPADAPQYRTLKVERGSMESAVTSSGIVSPVRQVVVGTQVSGQIVQLLADFNTEVKKGQLIARIDPENFENKVRQSSADLDVARAAVLTA